MPAEARALKVVPMMRPVHQLRAPNVTWCEKRVRPASRLILGNAEDPATCPGCRAAISLEYSAELKRQTERKLRREVLAKGAYNAFSHRASAADFASFERLPLAMQAGWLDVIDYVRDELSEDEDFNKFLQEYSQ
jgi:hypothetical protein